jgi:uncharacterized membrane protein
MRTKSICAVGVAFVLCGAAYAQTQYVAMTLQFGDAFTYGCAVAALSDNGLSAGICLDGVHQLPSMWDAQGSQTLLPVAGDAQITWVTGINSSGQVSGYYMDGLGSLHAVRWENGQIATLDATGSFSVANGINDSGDIVGSLNNMAAIWKRDGSVVSLPPPKDPGFELASTNAQAINALGAVVGTANYLGNPLNFSNALLWQRHKPVVLAPVIQSGFNVGNALNARGTVVGYAQENSLGGLVTAWMWTGTQAVPLPGLPGSRVTIANGINRSEVVVGISVTSDTSVHGVKWLGGQMTLLDNVSTGFSVPGGLISNAPAINSHGWIAVWYSVFVPPYSYPVILKPVR